MASRDDEYYYDDDEGAYPRYKFLRNRKTKSSIYRRSNTQGECMAS